MLLKSWALETDRTERCCHLASWEGGKGTYIARAEENRKAKREIHPRCEVEQGHIRFAIRDALKIRSKITFLSESRRFAIFGRKGAVAFLRGLGFML
jgi:hypothetical protein